MGKSLGLQTPFINMCRTHSTVLSCSPNIWLIASWFMDTLLMENRLLLRFISLFIVLHISQCCSSKKWRDRKLWEEKNGIQWSLQFSHISVSNWGLMNKCWSYMLHYTGINQNIYTLQSCELVCINFLWGRIYQECTRDCKMVILKVCFSSFANMSKLSVVKG